MKADRDKKTKLRTIWLSDIHLGTSFSKSNELLRFLDNYKAEQIILVGDIIDIWSMQSTWLWLPTHSQFMQKLINLSEKGVRIVYIPGNHDEFFRQYTDMNFGKIEIRERIEYRTQDGKRLLVVHGDEFDIFMQDSYRWLAHLGDRFFHVIQLISRITHDVRNWLGKDYWSLAGYMKTKTKGITKIIGKFENALILAARREGYDGVICGHIHHAEIKSIDNFIYMNCGDWVDSCTALVEDLTGDFQIVEWLKSEPRRPIGIAEKSFRKRNKIKSFKETEDKHV
ncbi:MAG: UDP-2,3-diacylglucosamine diphosphatase [Candidatus Marinimicrobia bacterium]|nr:UDP-2,3-diacylglucosamine diphosphatase [Candidatus Neomarinimicrobiota bacterium]